MADTATPARPGYFPPPPQPLETRPIARWVWVVAGVFLALAGLGGYVAFHTFRSQTSQAHSIIDTLHAQMRAGDMAGIFASSDPAYQEQVGRKKSDEIFTFLREKLGDPQSSKLTGWHVQTTTQTGVQETLVFDTRFAKGPGTETLVMHKVDGRMVLLRYNVESDLIPDSDVPADLKN